VYFDKIVFAKSLAIIFLKLRKVELQVYIIGLVIDIRIPWPEGITARSKPIAGK